MFHLHTLAGAGALILLAAGQASAQSAATGVSREFNPAISVNTLLLGRVADRATAGEVNGTDLQEAEVQLTSIVDPYWKANLVFAVHPAHAHEDGDEAHGGYAGDVEVASITGSAVPGGFGLVLGKDYLPFGKHAPLHTHQFPFVDAPAAVQAALGDHGLTEPGLRLSHDLPLPWYSDLTGYVVDGKAEVFDAASRDPVWGARWSNVMDLSLESTLELGGSWLHGPQAGDYLLVQPAATPLAGHLQVWGVDLTWKRVSSAASRGGALTLTGEVILPRPDAGAMRPLGWYALAQCRVARNWWLGGMFGGMDRDLPAPAVAPDDDLFAWESVREMKANLTWVPSEFSSVRLEVARFDDRGEANRDDTLVSLQINFTIGSHPAHLY